MKTNQNGFTLLELIAGIVVFAVGFVILQASMYPLFSGSVDPMFRIRAAELGQAYMEEIIGMRYDELSQESGQVRCGETAIPNCTASGSLGSEGGEGRATFDDVDDYDGLNESPPRDITGTVRTGFDNFRAQISVVYDGNYDGSADSNESAKLITITITDPLENVIVFSSYRANF